MFRCQQLVIHGPEVVLSLTAGRTAEAEVAGNGSGGQEEEVGPVSAVGSETCQAFIAAFQELRNWVDTNEAQYAALHANYELVQGRPALGIK